MKRITTSILLLVISTLAMAQGKLTTQARLHVEKQKALAERRTAAADPRTSHVAPRPDGHVTLVVKTTGRDAVETFAQMKAAGATVQAKLGRQAVISLPVDSLAALQRIEGIERIDKGHRGRLKSDFTRQSTGVNLLNGPSLPADATPYTGKGVTVCVIDAGIDFQHPAFKDAEGRSRIKCVYRMGDDGGHKFTVADPEAGEYTFPGSVYDTPELIATLTTDDTTEYHGTHTTAIAAGSLSPQGFGGMAPEADLVLIPLIDEEVEGLEEAEDVAHAELAIAFAKAYADQSDQPVVLSASMNSHAGRHDGTSSVTYSIEEASESLIPVFSAGNEGGYPIHLYQQFTDSKKSVKTILVGLMEDETGEYEYQAYASVAGYTRTGDEVGIQLSLMSVNQLTGKLTALWSTETYTITPGGDGAITMISSDEDEKLAKYFDGDIGIGAIDEGDGRLSLAAYVEGGLKKLYLFQLTVSGSPGTEIDLWDDVAGFGGVNFIGLKGLVDGKSDMSAGDWTSTDRVISVGAYCANTISRSYDGTTVDTSKGSADDNVDKIDDIGWFSSYGTSFNGIDQPTICAPGVNVVSAWNHYALDAETVSEDMQWQGYPYGAESGTSMACPAVAGILALWLQADPTLTLDDVKDVMAHSSVNDEYTAKSPFRWGFGRISASKGIAYITGEMSGIRGVAVEDEIREGVYDLLGRRVDGRMVDGSSRQMGKGIYICRGKKVVL